MTHPFRHATLLATALLLSMATFSADARKRELAVPTDDWQVASRALQGNDWRTARQSLSQLLRRDLRNGNLQFLHALAEENLARQYDRSQLETVAVGYRNAVKFAPGHYWALLNLGFLELERGDHDAAQQRFAEAAMDQPSRWEAFYGLGVASYYLQDLPLMAVAAERASTLAPENADALRLQAFALAVQGNPGSGAMLQRLAGGHEDPAALRHAERRVGEFMQVALRDTATSGGADGGWIAAGQDGNGGAHARTSDNNQVVVEVTILLSSVTQNESRGVNLFDGLRALYGYSNTLARNITSFGRDSTRTIVSQVSTPQLNYSLNLFNDSGQNYSVVARPSITALLGRQSQFFAGRTVNVAVSGINLGQLQPIDVGVNLAVTPEYIDGNKVTFQVNATRSFLSQDQVGTFDNSLTVFRQQVAATADIEFGQTLVLSALSEQVNDTSFSRIPVVGKMPVLDWFTSQSRDATRQESLLVLVTPTLPQRFDTPPNAAQRHQAVQELLHSWQQRIEPNAGIEAVLKRLHRHNRWLRTPEPGDLRVRLPQSTDWQREAIAESLLLARN